MRRFARHAASFAVTLLLGGLLGATLLRFGPGFDADERDLDARYSVQAREAIRTQRASERNILRFYAGYLERAIHGDFGVSRSLGLRVSELIASRGAVTLRLIGMGLLFGWSVALALAVASVVCRWPLVSVAAEMASGFCLSLPAAVVALLIFLANGPVFLVVGLAIFPRVFRNARDLFARSLSASQVIAARARGVPERWILWRCVMRPAAAPLVALAGVSVSLAIGAAIPVEVIADLPGLGQLAWKAAIGRDLPLLVALTLIVTAVTVGANSLADLVLERSAA